MPSRRFLIIVGVFWSAITGTALGVTLYGAINQLRTLAFATTEGVVDAVKVTNDDSGDSRTFGIKIAYHYKVAGRRYDSDRLRFRQSSSSDSWATKMHHRFAAGSHPIVHYNPGSPAEAVLIAGLQGDDLFILLFLMPFTMVMLLIWSGFAASFRTPRLFTGLCLTEEGSITRLRPSYWQAIAAAGVVLGMSSFFSIFIVAIPFGGFDPPFKVPAIAWIVVLALTIVAGASTWSSIHSGARDITLNVFSRTLTAPKGLEIAYKDIHRVNVLAKKEKNSDSSPSSTYVVWLSYGKGNEIKRVKLESWRDNEDDARRFAGWLRERVGLKADDEQVDGV